MTAVTADFDGTNDGAWHHVAAVFDRDRGSAAVYVDGSVVEDAAISGVGTIDINYDVHLGAVIDCGGIMPWSGLLDDVRYYGRALLNCEIEALAAN